jgi:hypothetical protein
MRKLFIQEHNEVPGLFKISEPNNPEFEEIFNIGNGIRETNIFSNYNNAVDWINSQNFGHCEIHIIFTIGDKL